MGIPGVRVKSEKAEQDQQSAPVRKKAGDRLASVVPETATPAAVELLRSNGPFVFPSGTAWVMLLLDVGSIGGLSKRDRRDATKGSIIELIEADHIHTVATPEMLEAEMFGVIPTTESLARMDEYSLLTSGAEYTWAVTWQNSSGDLVMETYDSATFARARDVAVGTMSLREAVGSEAWDAHSGESEPMTASPAAGVPDSAEASDSATGDSSDDEGDPILDPLEDEATWSHEEDTGEVPVFDEEDPEDDLAFGEPPFDEEPDGEETALPGEASVAEPAAEEIDEEHEEVLEGVEPEEEEEEVLVADSDEARAVLARRFLSEDLDLAVSLEEFDATFGIGRPGVEIEVPEGASEWLGDQVAQLNRQANADLSRLRGRHEDELRTLWVNLMSEHTEQVIKDVAMDKEGSRFTTLREGVERRHAEREDGKDERIRARKTEIHVAHEEAATQAGRQAAMHAEIQYKERHRPRMEREQTDAVSEIERVIENARDHDLQEVLRLRRRSASLKMQVGTTRIFEVLAERQSEQLDAEQELLTSCLENIQRIVDDNRKADVSRVEALTEYQRTTDEVGDLRREHEERVEAMREDHLARTQRLKEELERDRQEATARQQARDEEWQHSLDLAHEQTRSANQREKSLQVQTETMEGYFTRQWSKRERELTSERDTYGSQMEKMANAQSRHNTMLVLLLIVMTLFALTAGIVIGGGMSG